MQSWFRFTRQGMRSPYDVSVRLEAKQAETFSVRLAGGVSGSEAGQIAVLLGVESALAAAAPDTVLAVLVTEIMDHSGATGELGYKICGEAAMYHLLGQPQLAPFSGHAGEA